MTNFTPISSLLGGLIIGSAVVLYFYTTGRLAGISGIFANGLTLFLKYFFSQIYIFFIIFYIFL